MTLVCGIRRKRGNPAATSVAKSARNKATMSLGTSRIVCSHGRATQLTCRWGTGELPIRETLRAPPVRCSIWFGVWRGEPAAPTPQLPLGAGGQGQSGCRRNSESPPPPERLRRRTGEEPLDALNGEPIQEGQHRPET